MIWLLSLCLCTIDSKFIAGSFYRDNTQWAFLGRFCYDARGGKISFRFNIESSNPKTQQVLFYHDHEDSFQTHYGKGTSCLYKTSGSNRVKISLDKPEVNGTYSLKARRPRWWYVVIANCDGENIGIANYEITFTNEGGRFSSHFSKVEQGIFEALIVGLICATILLIGLGYTLYKQKKDPERHSRLTVWLLISIVITVISFAIQIHHRDNYAEDGIGFPFSNRMTKFLDLMSQTILVWIYINVSKGWVISYERIRDRRPVLEAMSIYFISLIAVIWWSMITYDPAIEMHLFDSPPGIFLMSLHIAILIWFICEMYHTWRHERLIAPAKRCFYLAFGMFGIMWLSYVPVVTITAMSMEDWNREKVVEVMDILFTILAYFTLWFMFGPKRSSTSKENAGKKYLDVKKHDNDDMESMSMHSTNALNKDSDDDDDDDSDNSETEL